MIFTYFLPIGVMGVVYGIIAKELWFSQVIGVPTDGQRDSIRSRRKVSVGSIDIIFRVPRLCTVLVCNFFGTNQF